MTLCAMFTELYTYCCVYVCMSVYIYVLHIFCVVHVCMYICTVVSLYNAVETP